MESSISIEDAALADRLASGAFWSDDDRIVLLPPHLEDRRVSIEAALDAALGETSGVVAFATSGSEGEPRIVCHTRESLRESAAAAAARFRLDAADVWFRPIPFYHVGGFGIHARAGLAGAGTAVLPGRWDPERAVREMESAGATLVSLVPTQVFDLAHSRSRCPGSIRTAVVGGAPLDANLRAEALALGWPVVATYGSTETASMVAVEADTARGKRFFTLFDGWDARADAGERLSLRGPSVCLGWLDSPVAPTFTPACDLDGWFRTDDLADVGRSGPKVTLGHLRRAGAVVKALGELVDLEALENALRAALGSACAVAAIPDPRRGARLVAVIEHPEPLPPDHPAVAALRSFNACRPGFQRLAAAAIPSIPRTQLGKVARHQLNRLAEKAAAGENDNII